MRDFWDSLFDSAIQYYIWWIWEPVYYDVCSAKVGNTHGDILYLVSKAAVRVHLTQLTLRLKIVQNPGEPSPYGLCMILHRSPNKQDQKHDLKTSISVQRPNRDSKSPAELPECGIQVCIWLASHWHPRHNLHIKGKLLELPKGVLLH